MNGKQTAAVALTMIVVIPILLGFAMASDTTTKAVVTVDETVSMSDILLNSSDYYYSDYTGPANNGPLFGTVNYWLAPDYVSTGSNESSVLVGSVTMVSVALTYGAYNSLDSAVPSTNYYLTTSADTAVRLTYSDGSTEVAQTNASCTFIRSGSTCVFRDFDDNSVTVYTLVSGVELMVDIVGSQDVYYYAPGTTYADVSYGWALNSASDNYFWTNGFTNRAVTFYLHMDTPSSGTDTIMFAPSDVWGDPSVLSGIDLTISSAGQFTVGYDSETYALGSYNDVQIVYDLYEGTCTVTGIAAWPTMGGTPTAYNTITLDIVETFTDDNFSNIYIDGSTDAVWRCDSAAIVAGTFPITEDYTLSMDSLFPDREYRLKINSVGIYGGSIDLVGTTYAVTDGTITVNGGTVNVRGMVIEVTEDDGTWTTSVNDEELTTSASAPTFTFTDKWSLTSTAEILKEETVTVEEWTPGGFAFDKDDFMLVMIMSTVGVFVALGLAKGVKVGPLLIVCTAAGIIAFIIA